MNIFKGYEDFVDNFGGHRKTELFFGIISMHLGLFLWSRYKMGIFLRVAKISNIFWGYSLYIFGVNSRCWSKFS